MSPITFIRFCCTALFLQLVLCYSVSGQGYHWEPLSSSNIHYLFAPSVTKFVFVDSEVGYFSFDHKLHRTSDGGSSWKTLTFPDMMEVWPDNLFAFGRSAIKIYQQSHAQQTLPFLIESKDAGETWNVTNWDFMSGRLLHFTMWDSASGYMYVVNQTGVTDIVVRAGVTHDGGVSFTEPRPTQMMEEVYKLAPYSFPMPAWSDSLHAIIGISPDQVNVEVPFFTTSDQGRSWSKHEPKDSVGKALKFRAIRVLKDRPNVWLEPSASAPNRFYYSEDYGETWNLSTKFIPNVEMLTPVGPKELWALGWRKELGLLQPDLILHTTDNGVTWDIDSTTAKEFVLGGLYFNSPTEGWLYGYRKDLSIDSNFHFWRYTNQTLSVRPKNHSNANNDIQGFTIYPNPATSAVSVNIISKQDKELSYTLYDVMGREVTGGTLSLDQNHIDLSSLSNGVYLLQITGPSKLYHQLLHVNR